ncbi:MAG: NAD(P)-dependent alcohol dehydrogenase, partial [Sneathiella sp.]
MKAWKLSPGQNGMDLDQHNVSIGEPGEGEVRVRIHAASLNKRDLMILSGQYPVSIDGSITPLSDGAGEITAVGANVDSLSLGDRVANLFWRDWIDGPAQEGHVAMGGEIDGVLAEEIILPAHALVQIPDTLSYAEAATLPCAALTAWNALMETGDLKAGQTVLTLGTGGVSLFALQFAKSVGARVIITSSSDEKLARAKELGADILINYVTTPNWAEEVQRLTDGKGADVVIETGGPGTLNQSLAAAGFSSQVTMIGVQAGADQSISPLPLLFKKIRLQGIMVGNRVMFENMQNHMVKHNIQPVVDQKFDFDDLPAAIQTMA